MGFDGGSVSDGQTSDTNCITCVQSEGLRGEFWAHGAWLTQSMEGKGMGWDRPWCVEKVGVPKLLVRSCVVYAILAPFSGEDEERWTGVVAQDADSAILIT